MSRTWFNFLCCSIKKQKGKQNRNVPVMKSRDRSILQWVHGFCGERNGTVLVRFCLRGVGAASSLSCMWSHMFLSKVMRSLNLSTVKKEKSHMVLMAAFVAYEGWSLRSPGPCDGSMSVSGSSLSPLNHLWVPHMRRCPRWHVLTSTCWRWAEFMSLCLG